MYARPRERSQWAALHATSSRSASRGYRPPTPRRNRFSMAALLDIRGLTTSFTIEDGAFNAVDGVSLTVEAGTTLGLVGESGCGKSVTALSVMGLIAPPGRIAAGEILFEGVDLL